MKLAAAQIAGFLKQPPRDLAAVLIYGPDEGLVRERGEAISRAVLGGTGDDPFRLALLTGDLIRQDPARLADEAAAMSLMGGRRVVRVREAGDAITKTLQFVLDRPGGDSLIVIEAGDLGKASSLRKLAEAAPKVAALACYADGPRELATLIRDTMAQHRISMTEEASAYLVEHLGGDRAITRQEIEKLTLLAGDGGRLGLSDIIASSGDTSALDIEDVVYDALDAQAGAVDAALSRLFLEGEAAIGILRAVQRHAQKLHLAGAQVAAGEPADGVMRGQRPPIFFKYADRFRRQLDDWPPERSQRLLRLLTQAELDCKKTGFPDQTICRHVLTTIGRLPGRPRRG